MIREYLFNFFSWWYLVKVKALGVKTVERIIFALEYTNTLPMAKYLTVPLFQDDSGIGKGISIVIRVIWVWCGGIVSLLAIIPIVIYFVFLVLLPVIAPVELIYSLIVVF